LFSDGLRLYFSELKDGDGYSVLAQVSSIGGQTVAIPSPFANAQVLGISPNRSELLVSSRLTALGQKAPLWTLPVLGGSPRRVGDLVARDAAWSPDGQRIVYANGSELYLAKSNGTESHNLVKLAGEPHWPRWSPDGGRLRFTLRDTKTASTSLWEVASDGKHLHPLLPGWSNPAAECCGSWTPDGKYFVFKSSHNEKPAIWAIREKEGFLRKLSDQPVQLTSGPMNFGGPAPSQDGSKLFVVGEHLRGELVRYDARTQQFVSYLSGISAEGLEFSKDGEWVAYVTYPEGNLWRSKVDGSQRLQLTFPPLQVYQSSWSPDGKKIAFAAHAPGRPKKVYVVSSQGGSPQQLMPEEQDELGPNWSPDGNSLVFGVGTRNTGNREIQLLDFKTHHVSTLPGSEGLFSPRWSPDGRYLSALPSDQQKLMLFNVRTQQWQELANLDINMPRWSRDGKYIYFLNLPPDQPALFRVRVGDQRLERLASLKGFQRSGPMGLAPDDSPLLTRDISTQEIYALDWEAP
jgi:Tol biopolymer transport system component